MKHLCTIAGIFVTQLFIFFYCLPLSTQEKIPLGAVFEQGTTQTQTAFKYALSVKNAPSLDDQRNNKGSSSVDVEFQAYVDVINTADAFKLSRIICKHFSLGVYALVGAVSPESFDTFHSYANTFQMPFLTPWFPEKMVSSMLDFATSMKPQFHRALIDTIHYYGWKSIIYLYCSQEGLHRLQGFFQEMSVTNESIHIQVVRYVSSSDQILRILTQIEQSNPFGSKHVVLDCPASMAQEAIINHVQGVQMGRRTYHYLISGLAMDEPWEASIAEYGALNVTGFRIVDPGSRVVRDFLSKWSSLDSTNFPGAGKPSISADAALMFDSISVLHEAFVKLLKNAKQPLLSPPSNSNGGVGGFGSSMSSSSRLPNTTREVHCATGRDFTDAPVTFELGERIATFIRRVKMEGLTGNIHFSDKGRRHNFTIDVMEMSIHSTKVKIAEWSDHGGFQKIPPKYMRPPAFPTVWRNQTFIVTSIIEAPYLMEKKAPSGVTLMKNDRYEGFCKDLADKLAEKLGFEYELKVVKDKQYGKEDPVTGQWDGMVGELMRREADVAIAPLTITADRERVIDFSKPFMSLGISIMVFKRPNDGPSVFAFMFPFSFEVWLCVAFAYIGVSIVLYLVSRFNPNEAKVATDGPPTSSISKDPMWFSFAALLQQGADTAPRSTAGRLVGAVWWFFTLILISSYTANFAAVRTNIRMVTPIQSAEDLAKQTDVEYGTMLNGATKKFFESSHVQLYERMWEFMSSKPQVFVTSYDEGVKRVRQSTGKYALLIESPANDYISGRHPCDTLKVGRNLDAKGFGIGTPIGSPLKHQINLAILSFKESGTLMQLEQRWWENTCPQQTKEESGGEDELNLKNLAGIFYILIAGLVIAMLIAIVEFCWNTRREAKKRQITLKEAMKVKTQQLSISGKEDCCTQTTTASDNGLQFQGSGGGFTGSSCTLPRGRMRYATTYSSGTNPPVPNL